MLLANSNWATINTSSSVIFCSKPAFFAILKTVFRIRQQHLRRKANFFCLADDEAFERGELAEIYVLRGLEPQLAEEVARQLMAHDALGAHARDELGLSSIHSARPIQAALASAVTFAIGAALPLLLALLSPLSLLIPIVSGGALVLLALMGGAAARAGGANVALGAGRVSLWGALAMVATAAVGALLVLLYNTNF